MADKRKARRLADPGLQPERTSLAWLRTLLGYGALMALALRHSWPQAGALLWVGLVILALVLLIMWRYARRRNLMDVAISDFYTPQSLRARLAIAIAVFSLALLFSLTHLRTIFLLLF